MMQEPGGAYTESDIERFKMVAGMCQGDVLDIGCGNSSIRTYLPASCRYTGIDSQPTFVGSYGDVYSLELTQKYDTVLLLEVLEHLENPVLALKNIKPYLWKAGKLIISVPNPYNLDQIASVFRNDTNIENPNHINLFGDNEIRAVCFAAGYSTVRPVRFFTKVPGLNRLLHIPSRWGEWNIYEVMP